MASMRFRLQFMWIDRSLVIKLMLWGKGEGRCDTERCILKKGNTDNNLSQNGDAY